MSSECVKVIVRCRPMNTKEKNLNCNKIIKIDQAAFQVEISRPRVLGSESGKDAPAKTTGDSVDYEPKGFIFDSVFDDDSFQRDVYESSASALVHSVLEGYNGTIFAYGQTGCGKTFTMEGVRDNPELQGIIPCTFDQVFSEIAAKSNSERTFLVRASYLEIYNEEVRDLTSSDPNKKCEIKEDKDKGVYVKNLEQAQISCVEDLHKLMKLGNSNRTVGATLMNADSSRSPSIFTLTVEMSEPDTTTGKKDDMKIRVGKLNLVDLAGSERQSKTQAAGVRLKEATKINLSLSALGNVIEALVKLGNGQKGLHIPYRDSKLTRLLQDSLGGNTKTVMIAAISPADYNYDETLSTLRYANRAKNIKNKPKINEDPKDALLREYQLEIQRLKELLSSQGLAPPMPSSASINSSKPQQVSVSATPKASSAPGPKADANVKVSSAAGAVKQSSSGETTPSASTNEHNEQEEKCLLISDEAKQRLDDEEEEIEEDVARIRAEKMRHEAMSILISDRIEMESKEVEEKKRIYQEAINQGTGSETSEKQLKESQQEFEELKFSLESEKEEHDKRIEELNEELKTKLKEEEDKRREIESKYISIKEKSSKEKDIWKAKLNELQEKLLNGREQMMGIKQGMDEEYDKKIAKILEREAEMKKKAQQLQEEKQKNEVNFYKLETKYADVQTEIKSKNLFIEKLQKKLKTFQQEFEEERNDLQHQKENLLDELRDTSKESALFQTICNMFLSQTELNKIIAASYWDENKEKWIVKSNILPVFLPSLVNTSSKDALQNSIAMDRKQQYLRSKMHQYFDYSNLDQQSVYPQEDLERKLEESKVRNMEKILDKQRDSLGESYRELTRDWDELNGDRNRTKSSKGSKPQTASKNSRPVSKDWKRSIVATVGDKEPTPSIIAGEQAAHRTREMSENLADMTSNLKRRAAFDPGSVSVLQEEKSTEATGNDALLSTDLLPKRPNFAPPQIVSPRQQMYKDQLSTRPAATNIVSLPTPSRPNFIPAAISPQSNPNDDVERLLATAPRGRTFQPASLN